MGKPSAWKSIAAGGAGGLAGALGMNGFYWLINRASNALWNKPALNQDEDASIKTARTIARHVFGHELTNAEEKPAAAAVHYAMGIGLGAAYGLMADKCELVTAGSGAAFGAAVWLGADEIGVPAMGFAYGPAQTEISAHVNALASHVVYGVVTELVRRLALRAIY